MNMSSFFQVQLVVDNDSDMKNRNIKEEDGSDCINLTREEYRDIDGKPCILPSVRLAEEAIHNDAPIIADYLFPNSAICSELAAKLILGEDSPALEEDRICSTQTVSGTGAIRLGADFLVRYLKKTTYYYSDPTWNPHLTIFASAGFKKARSYRYWCSITHDVDFVGLLEDLKSASEGAVILLQASAHNPTGIDLTKDQWKQIALIMRERRLFPFFDCAFQGLADDLDRDAWPVRYFVDQGFELFCAQSFSKNCGVYSDRIGNFVVVTKSTFHKDAVQSHLGTLIRGMYLIPSAHGNRVVSTIWSRPEMRSQWIRDLESVRNRVNKARKQLRATLERLGTPGDWSFMTRQRGIACMTGLNETQVQHMANKYQIYLLPSGRANISALATSKIDSLAQAIHETIISVPNKPKNNV